jgi:hypothetical protein
MARRPMRIPLDALAVLDRHRDELLTRPGVVGVAIGEKVAGGEPMGEVALRVFVRAKIDPVDLPPGVGLPPFIEALPTDVVQQGTSVLHANVSRRRPMLPGISLGGKSGSGTFGCVLRSEAGGGPFLLSNNHVIARLNASPAGAPVYQPGSADRAPSAATRVGGLYRFRALELGAMANTVDCAVAALTASPNMLLPQVLDGWGTLKAIPGWFGDQTHDGAICVWDSGSAKHLIVLHINHPPSGPNEPYYRIGKNLSPTGDVKPSDWLGPIKIELDWWGEQTQAAGIAVWRSAGDYRLIVFHVDHGVDGNRGYYRVSGKLDLTTGTAGPWGPRKAIPGWWGNAGAGGGIAVADLRGVGSASDLVVFHIDNPPGANGGYYRLGLGLDAAGDVATWVPPEMPFAIPGGWGDRTHGGGVAIADLTGSGMPDLIFAHVDNAKERNIAYFRIGTDLSPDGTLARGTDGKAFGADVRQISGWIGNTTAAADVAAADLDGDGNPELLFFHVNDPAGENAGFYRVGIPQKRTSDLAVGLNGWVGIDLVNVNVWKSGRTSELTNGTVTDTGYSGVITDKATGADMLFQGLIRTEPRIGAPGDSGSVLVDDTNRVVGLHVGGAEESPTPLPIEGTDPGHGLACRIENVLDGLRWSDRKPIGGLWGESTAGAGLAVWNDAGTFRLVAVNVDNPAGANAGWTRISAALDSNGDTRGWSSARKIERTDGPTWWGDDTEEAGAAVWDTGAAQHLIVVHVDLRPGGNRAYYRIGWDLSSAKTLPDWGATRWSPHMEIPGVWGERTPGLGAAVWSTPAGDHLVVFHLEAPPGPNQGYYRIGRNLDPVTGTIKPTDWGPPQPIPGWWGEESAGGGLAIAELWGKGDTYLVVFHIDGSPETGPQGFYRIGRLDPDTGTIPAAAWSPKPLAIEAALPPPAFSLRPGWAGPGDVAILDLTANGAPDLVALDVAPGAGFYRVAYDLIEATEAPARWSVV